jgi:DNA-binding transcriptional LysR family regulator
MPFIGWIQPASSCEAMLQLTLASVGIARLAAFLIKDELAADRLVSILEDRNPGDVEEIHAVYLGQGRLLPAPTRAFLDFLSSNTWGS